MSETTINRDHWTVHVEHEPIMVSSYSPRPDPDWRYTDEAGHEHYYDEATRDYPTLIAVIDEVGWCQECRDDHEESHLECRICGEHVSPGTRGPSPIPEYLPGPTSVSLTYDDGIEHRDYAILTAEDAAGLADPATRWEAVARIAATQEPAQRERRSFMDAPAALRTARPERTLEQRVECIERIFRRIAEVGLAAYVPCIIREEMER